MDKYQEPINHLFEAVGFERPYHLRIAGTFTTEPVRDSLDFWISSLGLRSKVEFADYNQIFRELLDPNGLLRSNVKGANILLIRLEDWAFDYEDTEQQNVTNWEPVKERLDKNVKDFISMLEEASMHGHVPFIVACCPDSPDLIAKEAWQKIIAENMRQLEAKLRVLPSVMFVKNDEVQRLYSVPHYYDAEQAHLGHIPFTSDYFVALGTTIARRFFNRVTPAKKVLAVDCDNTLWTGIVGEAGVEGIELDESRLAIQRMLEEQQKSGVLLSLCSKNNEEDVRDVFEKRKDMVLSKDQIVNWKVNWNPKSENIQQLAGELNLGLDSFVFIDDNPVECAEVETHYPEVLTLQIPTTEKEIDTFIKHTWTFDQLGTTAEDQKRTELYQENMQRRQFEKKQNSFKDFLDGLNLELHFEAINSENIARVSQLTQRTNQFNATTIRRTENEMDQWLQQDHVGGLAVRVKDRFGDYGLVGVLIYGVEEEILRVETFLLSCRVLGRGIEHRMMAAVGDIADKRESSQVCIEFIPTAKNTPVETFLETLGKEYKQPYKKGYQFEFPSVHLKSIRFQLEEKLTAVNQGKEKKKKNSKELVLTDRRAMKQRSMLQTLWRDLSTIQQIQEAIQQRMVKRVSKKGDASIEPQTDKEKQLAAIWCESLNVDLVGMEDDFFESGGSSMEAVQIMAKIQQEFNIMFPYHLFLHHPTLSTIAHQLNYYETTGEFDEAVDVFPDLNEEAVLDDAICPAEQLQKISNNPQHLFLTGATGFLGGYLLQSLIKNSSATLHCLVRAENKKEGHERLQINLEKYGLWHPEYKNRIRPMLGDLSQPCLGLSLESFEMLAKEIDVIYHNGAMVNFVYPYSKLKTANVEGTKETLRLACMHHTKPVHFISSTAIFDSPELCDPSLNIEETFLGDCEHHVLGGYSQTKWVAEKLCAIAAGRGVPVTIYRPGGISGSSKTGDMNMHDTLSVVLLACLQTGWLPDKEAIFDFVPVDYLSEVIAKLSLRPESEGRVFHLVHPAPVTTEQLLREIRSCGRTIEMIGYEQWVEQIISFADRSKNKDLQSLLPLFREPVVDDGRTWIEMVVRRPSFDHFNVYKIPSQNMMLTISKKSFFNI